MPIRVERVARVEPARYSSKMGIAKTVVVLALVGACGGKPEDTPVDRAPRVQPPTPRVPAEGPPAGNPNALPEAGPHPDYPTPVSAGTDKIFTLEDPERGPNAPRSFTLPPRGSLVWTTHAFCADDEVSIVCSPRPPTGLASWRVGRKGKETTVAEQLRAGKVIGTYVYLAKPDGTPTKRIELDAYGHVASQLLVADGKRFSGRRLDGSNALAGCGSMRFQLDKQGRLAELACLQWTGEPMRDTHGVASTTYTRDASGFVTEERRFGVDGKPLTANDGVQHVSYTLDDVGRMTSERYLDAGDSPVQSTTGCYGRLLERDDRGIVARSTCLDPDGTARASVAGTAIDAFETDARGCRIGVRRLDVGGKPGVDQDQVHGEDYVVDDHCAITSRTCLDLRAQPHVCGPGEPARYVMKRDGAGHVVSTKHFLPDGTAGGDPDYEVFEVRWQYDDRGRKTGESCFDQEGARTQCDSAGFHRLKTLYDDAGRATEEHYFDEQGRTVDNLGATVHRYRYDNYDHLYESRSFDAKGELTVVMGASIRRELYDAAQRHFGVLMLDKEGKPAPYVGCYVGLDCPTTAWHAVRIVRRTDSSVEQNLFFDVDGTLISKLDCTHARCFD